MTVDVGMVNDEPLALAQVVGEWPGTLPEAPAGGAEHGVAAVSYTHLDVYKRQVTQWLARPAGASGNGLGHSPTTCANANGSLFTLSLIHI